MLLFRFALFCLGAAIPVTSLPLPPLFVLSISLPCFSIPCLPMLTFRFRFLPCLALFAFPFHARLFFTFPAFACLQFCSVPPLPRPALPFPHSPSSSLLFPFRRCTFLHRIAFSFLFVHSPTLCVSTLRLPSLLFYSSFHVPLWTSLPYVLYRPFLRVPTSYHSLSSISSPVIGTIILATRIGWSDRLCIQGDWVNG